MSESEGTREEQWKKAALKAQDLQIWYNNNLTL